MSDGKINSKTMLAKLQSEYIDSLYKAHERGQKIAWVNGLFPQEFLEAMDIQVAYPENLAATLGAKKGVIPYLDKAESLGYSNDLCSYTRFGLGYEEDFNSDIGNIPKPDIILNCTNICGLCVKWFENTAKRLNVPYILIDTPFQPEYDATENDVDYIVGQFKEMIRQLEAFCGKTFDYEKFSSVMKISRRVAKSWKRATNYVNQIPTPLDGFNLFNYMILAVCCRGKESTADYYDLLADELEELVCKRESQFKGKQKYRIMWDGIAVWPYLGKTYKTMRSNDMVLTGSFYPAEWCVEYEQDDIRSLARSYANRPPIGSLKRQVDARCDIMQCAQCDGTLYHVNRSCKILSFMQPAIRKAVYEMNHKPYATFDGDQTDPDGFSIAQFETRVQALKENLEAVVESGGK